MGRRNSHKIFASSVTKWEEAEILRSASEASKLKLLRCQVARYINPLADTPYPLEFAFYLLGSAQVT
jgi:hypothetical protein